MNKGREHTWDLILHYHACPVCQKIIESRTDWDYRAGKLYKSIHCPRCQKNYTISKTYSGPLGPMIGTPEKPEFDWSGSP